MRRFNITVNGTPYIVDVEELAANAAASPVMPTAPAAIAAPAAVAAPAAAAATAAIAKSEPAAPAAAAPAPVSGIKLTAPMPGTIIRYSKKDGVAIKKGETAYILESMKMENEIISTADGKITYIVREGAMVSAGETIAVIE